MCGAVCFDCGEHGSGDADEMLKHKCKKKLGRLKKIKSLGKKVFIIDDSVLVKMFSKPADERSKYAVMVLEQLREMENKNVPFKAFTTWSCFLRAIWLSEDLNLHGLKEVIDLINFFPIMPVDFKDEEKTRSQLIIVAKALHEGGGDKHAS